MKIKTHRATLAKARQIELKLRATDPRFNRAVTITLDDGSHFHWVNAFIRTLSEQYIGIFTEHYGTHVFDKSDILSIEYSIRYVE